MRLFLFENLDRVSDNYHPRGGLVVVARDDDHMRELVAQDANISLVQEEWGTTAEGRYGNLGEKEATPLVFELAGEYEPALYVFPDAGCC